MKDVVNNLIAATEGNMDLTADIYEALGCQVIRTPRTPGGYAWKYRGRGPRGYIAERWQVMEPLTESLDAAQVLIPPDFHVSHLAWDDAAAVVILGRARGPDLEPAGADTPALAVCIAALTARQEPKS